MNIIHFIEIMAKKKIYDDPANRDSALAFCRACGHETYHGKNCWDGLSSGVSYFKYKKAHPEFAQQVEDACRAFTLLSKQDNLLRCEKLFQDIQNAMDNGEKEVTRTVSFEFKRDKNGKILHDTQGMPITGDPVGNLTIQEKLKPVPLTTKIRLFEKFKESATEL